MKTRLILSVLFLVVGCTVAWFNIQSQQTQILVNTTGVEVIGNVAFKRQKLRSSGRSISYANTFTVYYFDSPPDEIRKPIILEVFGKEIEISKGPPYIGDFYSYDIDNVPDAIYETTNEGDDVAVLYLPNQPEKIWLKTMVTGKTEVDPMPAIVVVGIAIMLSVGLFVGWPKWMRRVKAPAKR